MKNLSLEATIKKMTSLTREGQIEWEPISLRRDNIQTNLYVENIGHAMMATVTVGGQTKSFSSYRYSYRFFTDADYDEYTICENIQLDICDPISYNSRWSFPASPYISDLYDAAIIQSEGIDKFINSFLEK